MGLYRRGPSSVLRNPGDLLYLDANGNLASLGTANATGDALDVIAGLPSYGVVVAPPPPPPPPPSGGPTLPQAPFTKFSSAQWYRNAGAPQLIDGLDVEGTPDYGVGLMQWPPVMSPSPFTMTDIITQNVGHLPPTMNGTGEAGIWIGQSCNANRLVCDGTWMGLWTGAMCCDCVIQNFTIGKADGAGGYTNPVNHVGLYVEHYTRRVTFQNFQITSGNSNGINSEWWYPDATYSPFANAEYPATPAGEAGACENTYDTGRVYCPAGAWGMYLDMGSWGNTVKNITFWGPGNAIRTVGPLHGPVANNIMTSTCTFLNGGLGYSPV